MVVPRDRSIVDSVFTRRSVRGRSRVACPRHSHPTAPHRTPPHTTAHHRNRMTHGRGCKKERIGSIEFPAAPSHRQRQALTSHSFASLTKTPFAHSVALALLAQPGRERGRVQVSAIVLCTLTLPTESNHQRNSTTNHHPNVPPDHRPSPFVSRSNDKIYTPITRDFKYHSGKLPPRSARAAFA